ncbi:hypothetical protein [Sporolactobacillus sp. KGMB 08714]|uniref:hypothetical protein n=1 Tax=Sporolactobacillus sp. KGMB 08714 TaxID=3064704 RepID=UPI002FBD74B2
MTTILKNGALRGEIQPEETPRIISLPLDLLRRELIMRREPISDKTIEKIADDIFLPFIHAQP